MNTKLHTVTDTSRRPIRLFITAGQVSDYTGAAALMNGLPEAEWLLADRGYDAEWFRDTLIDKGTAQNITECYDNSYESIRSPMNPDQFPGRVFGILWVHIATKTM
jgi:transposase